MTASANMTANSLVATPTVGIVVQTGLAVAERAMTPHGSAGRILLVILAVGNVLF